MYLTIASWKLTYSAIYEEGRLSGIWQYKNHDAGTFCHFTAVQNMWFVPGGHDCQYFFIIARNSIDSFTSQKLFYLKETCNIYI